MEYDVTIENQGNLDARLNDILTNLENENSEAVIITFSGYTKGEILKIEIFNTKSIYFKRLLPIYVAVFIFTIISHNFIKITP